MALNKIERAVRRFVRNQFQARIVKIDGVAQVVTHRTSARVLIKNPIRTKHNLTAKLGKPIAQSKHVSIFKVGKVGTIALITHGTNSVLKIANVK